MMQLLAQLKDERQKLPMHIEWDRCYQAIEMVIENNYLQMEKEQIIVSFYEGMKTNTFDPNMGRGVMYYNETYNQ